MEEEYDDALKKYNECKIELEKRKAKRLYFKSVKATLDHIGDAVTTFDERLWCNLLEPESETVITTQGMEEKNEQGLLDAIWEDIVPQL